MEQANLDPNEYPKINLGGTDYEVKFRCSDILKLKKEQNIDLLVQAELKGTDVVERLLLTLSVGLRHAKEFTVEQLADMVDLGDIQRIANIISQAVNPATQKRTETRPAPVVN